MTQDYYLETFINWYEHLPRRSKGFPAKGTISGALVVLEHLQGDFDLSIDSHTAKGGSQVRGAGGAAVRRILAAFSETREFVSEGGRTNRGLRGDIKTLLQIIESLDLEQLNTEDRNEVLQRFQAFLVDRVRDFHSQQRLEVVYNPALTTWQMVSDLLDSAKEAEKEGPVAQYLVGAKLQRRFPNMQISNESYSTADVQLGRQGDFLVNHTVFHVTVAPTQALFIKCQRNLRDGYKVYLLVRDNRVVGAKQLAEQIEPGRITVESVESFVSQNIDELSTFSHADQMREFRYLLDTYNQRVDAIELNKSMLIEIPPNLPAVEER